MKLTQQASKIISRYILETLEEEKEKYFYSFLMVVCDKYHTTQAQAQEEFNKLIRCGAIFMRGDFVCLTAPSFD